MKNEMVYNVREITNIRELLEGSFEANPDNIAFLWRTEGDGVSQILYHTLMEDVRGFATYLNAQGLEGKKIAVIGQNCYGWALTYLTVCAGTGIIVPLDKELRADEIEALLIDSEASAVVYADAMSEKLDACRVPTCTKINMKDIPDHVAEGLRLIEEGDRSYAEHKIDPFGLGVLLYTSGTTGVAKGVMLSQYNICSDILHVVRRLKVSEEDRVLSVLPLHHTYECMAGFLTVIYIGGSVAYNDSLRRLMADFALFRPTILVSVPLFLETFQKTIMRKYSKLKGGRVIYSAQNALAVGSESWKRAMFKTVHQAFGGRLRMFLCGAAAVRPDTYRFFEKMGIAVRIGYGLTETAPVCLMHNDFYHSADDIGYPLVGVQAKLFDVNEEGVGELAVKGPNVMLGYYKNPAETEKVFCDGWFLTGDLARVKPNGAYQITGRKKSMIVAYNGKKIFPEELEHYLEESPLVSECFVYPTGEADNPIVTAAVYPCAEEVKLALEKRGATEDDEEALKLLLMELVRDINKKFPNYKHIQKLIVRKTEFAKTTTRKIKRNDEENRQEK